MFIETGASMKQMFIIFNELISLNKFKLLVIAKLVLKFDN